MSAGEGTLEVKQIASQTALIPILGTAPLITHRWSEKSKRQMLDAQQGRKSPKEPRDPEAEFQGSMYRMQLEENGVTRHAYGFPSVAFKAATVSAARLFDKSVTMVQLRQLLFFRGFVTPADDQALVEIILPEGAEPVMREDTVRVGQGTDLRYRAMFTDWRAELRVTFVPNAISKDSVLTLINAGGMTGVGEWRPQKGGEYGTYELDESREVRFIG